MVSPHLSGSDSFPRGAAQGTGECRREGRAGRLCSSLLPPLFLGFSLVGALAIGLAPRDDEGQLAVIGAPWQGLERMAELVAAADGRIVEAGGLSNVILAQSDQPGFVAALYKAGAWLVLHPGILRGCLGFGEGTR